MFPISETMRARNLAHLRRVHPVVRPYFERFLAAALARGWPLAITQSLRTEADQAKLYALGRTVANGDATDAKPLGSVVTNAATAATTPHGRGAAIDVAFLIDGKLVGPRPGPGNDSWDAELPWDALGKLGEEMGLVWGGRFRSFSDKPHFETTGWKALPFPPVYAGSR